MTRTPKWRSLTIAFHPTSEGFGWVAFESPLALVDWNLVYVTMDKNAACLRRLEKLFARLSPETLVLEAFERGRARADRIQRLCRGVVDLAQSMGIDVAILTRDEVKACFAEVGAVTRQEIAQAVARSLEALQRHLPRPRQTWDNQDPRIALFSAAAVGLSHFRLSSAKLLDSLDGR
jgi:Holliday junction resolvasome RuvABC endonuclease subunit